MSQPASAMGKLMKLNYPQHVVEYSTYEEAQAAVDYLADNKFPVENILIVGTNLKLLERVTGRRTWGHVIVSGAMSGVMTGLLVGLMLMFFAGDGSSMMLWVGLTLGIVFGVIAQGLTYAMSGGKRDFNSQRVTVAASYEVLAEHKVAQAARDLLMQRPGARAALFE